MVGSLYKEDCSGIVKILFEAFRLETDNLSTEFAFLHNLFLAHMTGSFVVFRTDGRATGYLIFQSEDSE